MGNIKIDHGINLSTDMVKFGIECFCLIDGTWEAIQNDAIFAIRLFNAAEHHSYRDFIWNELTPINKGLCSLAEFCFVFKRLAEHIAARNVTRMKLLREQRGLCSLPRSLWSD